MKANNLSFSTVYLALGSNVGERHKQLAIALVKLQAVVEIREISSVYETEPIGYRVQRCFLNMVCVGKTSASPQELLHAAKNIEQQIGRVPSFRNGPRCIDIDILLYDQLCLVTEQLIIPHPRLYERAFVLVPLAEIAPTVLEPVSGKTVQELLMAIPQTGVHKRERYLEMHFDE